MSYFDLYRGLNGAGSNLVFTYKDSVGVTRLWDVRCESASSPNFHIFNSITNTNGSGVWLEYNSVVSTNTHNWNALSDLRLKRDIVPLKYGIETILKLNPVKFRYNSSSLDSPLICGFIAQEIETVLPEYVSETKCNGSDFDVKGVSTSGIVPIIVKSMQEQYKTEEVKPKIGFGR